MEARVVPVATSVVVPAGCVVRDEAPHIQGHIDAGLVDQGRATVVSLPSTMPVAKTTIKSSKYQHERQEYKQAETTRE
jgi:hypothetical protein